MSHALPDTIAALATPVGTSALAVLRVSGPGSHALYEQVFGHPPTPRQARLARFRDERGETLDEGLAVFFAGPHSFTGEDGFEFTAHGNPLLVQRLLAELLRRGCRSAEPGEFTRRAFLQGKLDLSQAEAIVDLIHARSERALAVANKQLNGSLGRHLQTLIETLLQALARIEAYIDFPEEDLPQEDRNVVGTLLREVQVGTGRLLATRRYGDLLREGIRTVILGEPNAGKSSLLNRLVGHDRALVSPEPGTTRDFIEEVINLGPHCLRLIDTAGLNPNPTPLEKLGMEKALAQAATADLFLLVLDSSRDHPTLPEPLLALLGQPHVVIAFNKCDLGPSQIRHPALANHPIHLVSALTGAGLDPLTQAIIARAERFRQELGEDTLAINARHADALERAQQGLAQALDQLQRGTPTELLSSEVRGALDALGEISGRIDNERMLDALFSTFCIGK